MYLCIFWTIRCTKILEGKLRDIWDWNSEILTQQKSLVLSIALLIPHFSKDLIIVSCPSNITDPTFFKRLNNCLMSQQYDWCHIAVICLLASKIIIFLGTEILSFVLSVIKFFTCVSWSGRFLTCIWEECFCFCSSCNSTPGFSIHVSCCQCNICDLTWNLILNLHKHHLFTTHFVRWKNLFNKPITTVCYWLTGMRNSDSLFLFLQAYVMW